MESQKNWKLQQNTQNLSEQYQIPGQAPQQVMQASSPTLINQENQSVQAQGLQSSQNSFQHAQSIQSPPSLQTFSQAQQQIPVQHENLPQNPQQNMLSYLQMLAGANPSTHHQIQMNQNLNALQQQYAMIGQSQNVNPNPVQNQNMQIQIQGQIQSNRANYKNKDKDITSKVDDLMKS